MKLKHILSWMLFTGLSTATVFSQTEIMVDSPKYFQAKENGTLGQYTLVQNLALQVQNGTATPMGKPSVNTGTPKTSDCDCFVTPDATYSLALQPNDDGSSGLITLPFTFSFYGTNYTSLYINNNGNVTFGNGLSTYSSTAFPSANNKIIAPFWADVDTRGTGQVLYKITPTAIFINWYNVGYYSSQTDKKNNFQLILSNGADPAIPAGNNVAFCYRDMQWTTGAASSGVNGFGGVPATAGTNKGDNVAFFQVGRFDHAGNDFDGPLGSNDGISYLDNRSFFFDITGVNNIPPISQGVTPCDTFKVCTYNDTADFMINFLSPELNQTTTITWTSSLPSLQEVLNTPGNNAKLTLRVIGNPADAGFHTVTVTATDSYVPAGVTTLTFYVEITDIANALDPQLSFTTACNQFPVSVLNGPFDGYLWDNQSTAATGNITQSGVYGVTVNRNGCYKRIEQYIEVPEPQPFMFQGNLFLCPGEDSTFVSVNNPNISVMNWNTGNPAVDGNMSMWLLPGTYTIHNEDQSGYCDNDTTFTIAQGVASQIFNNAVQCGGLTHLVTGSFAGTQGTWSSPNPEISFSSVTASNPVITATQPGIYTVNLTSPCATPLQAQIIFTFQPTIFPNDTTCGNTYTVDPATVNSFDGGTWSTVAPTIISFSDPNIPNPVITTNFVPYSSQVVYTDKYCPSLKASAVIVFVAGGDPQVPAIGCNLQSDGLSVETFKGGEWFIVGQPAGSTYTFPNGSTSTTPGLTVSTSGIYTVEFRDQFCGNKQKEIKFLAPISVDLKDSTLCYGVNYELSATTTSEPANYTWSTGETGTTTIVVNESGEYKITAQNECETVSDIANIEFFMCDIAAPNVISLSSTAGNNVWYVQADGVAEFECTIVNRWGNVVYTYTDVTAGWDGKDKSGNLVGEGVYFYNIKAKAVGGNEIKKHGFITVVH